MMQTRLRELAINSGVVTAVAPAAWRLRLPPTPAGYADAQIDDYGLVGAGRRHYPWSPGTRLRVQARFSHPAGALLGTAGFGFWNAPFGDPTVRRPALPQAAWFFYASAPGDLPLAPQGPGRGWFAATLDAAAPRALALIPVAPLVLLLNQVAALRRRLWPTVQRRLGISFAPLDASMTVWRSYELAWRADGCVFTVDGRVVLQTPFAPRGPLGFVCWIDNQYLAVKAHGRYAWGVLPTSTEQWLEVAALQLERF
jgi:hypothetical protein